MSLTHPLYGEFEPGWRDVAGLSRYEMNHALEFRNKVTKKPIKPKTKRQVPLFDEEGTQRKFSITELALKTFFPRECGTIILNNAPKTDAVKLENVSYLTLGQQARETKMHAVYGEYKTGWVPVICSKSGKEFSDYLIDHHSRVYSIVFGWIMNPDKNQMVRLTDSSGTRIPYTVTHLTLSSFFPDANKHETVDHIDENRRNHYIENLQWMSKSEQSIKSQRLQPRHGGDARSKRIYLLDGKDGNRIRSFYSSKEASEELQIPRMAITFAASQRKGAYGMYFEYETFELEPGEYAVTSELADALLKQADKPLEKKYRATNHGRFITPFGIIKRGTKMTRNGSGRYRCSIMNGISMLDHQWIYIFFRNKMPPSAAERDENGQIIVLCHDDSITYDEEGCYRNYPEDLTLDTQHNNMISHHRSKRQKL